MQRPLNRPSEDDHFTRWSKDATAHVNSCPDAQKKLAKLTEGEGENVLNQHQRSMIAHTEMLDGLDRQNKDIYKAFADLGTEDEVRPYQKAVQKIADKLAEFSGLVMNTNGRDVRLAVVNAKMGILSLKQLKKEVLKDDADRSKERVAELLQTTVEYLSKGKICLEIGKELDKLSKLTEELISMSVACQDSLEQFLAKKDREAEQLQLQLETELNAGVQELTQKHATAQRMLESKTADILATADEEVAKARAEIEEMRARKARLQEEFEEKSKPAALAKESAGYAWGFAKTSSYWLVGLGVVSLGLAAAAVAVSGGALAVPAAVGWACAHAAGWTGAAALVAGACAVAGTHKALTENDKREKALEDQKAEIAAMEKEMEVRETQCKERLKKAIKDTEEEERTVQVELQQLLDDKHQKVEEIRAQQAARRQFGEVRLSAIAGVREFAQTQQLFIEELKEAKINESCVSMVEALGFLSAKARIVECSGRLIKDESELVFTILEGFSADQLQLLEEKIQVLGEVNEKLVRQAAKVYNLHHELTGIFMDASVEDPDVTAARVLLRDAKAATLSKDAQKRRMLDDDEKACGSSLETACDSSSPELMKGVSLEDALAPLDEAHRQPLLERCRQKASLLESSYPDMTPDQRGILVAYSEELPTSSESPYWQVNETMRNGTMADSPWMPFMSLCMDSLSALPRPKGRTRTKPVFRAYKKTVDELGEGFQTGSILKMNGFTSATLTMKAAQGFMGKTEGTILIMTPLQPLHSIKDFSAFPDEDEVIIPPNTKWEVISEMDMGNFTTLQLEELPE
jgi:Skp family chaperone for outer membrane proteins